MATKEITSVGNVTSMGYNPQIFTNYNGTLKQSHIDDVLRHSYFDELLKMLPNKSGSNINMAGTKAGALPLMDWTKNLAQLSDYKLLPEHNDGTRYGYEYKNLPKGTYSYSVTCTSTRSRYLCVFDENGVQDYSTQVAMNQAINYSGTFEVPENGIIRLWDSAGVNTDTTSQIMIAQGINTNYVPYNGYEITACGKNLVKNDVINYRYQISDLTFTPNADGSVTINGTAPTSGGYPRIDYYNSKEATFVRDPNKDYVIKATGNTDCYLMAFLFNSDYSAYKEYSAIASDTIIPKDTYAEYTNVQVSVAVKSNGASFNNVVIYPQVEVGTVSTQYEQYKSTVVHVTNDTVAPVYGLETFDGQTNVIAPSDVTVGVSVDYALQEVKDAIVALGTT